jgi:ribosomal protein S18 acetylase RimI-like enzyme
MSEVRLSPLSEAEFSTFREANIKEMADENVSAGIWNAKDALERSRKTFDEQLPDGLGTKDNYLFVINDQLTGQPIGYLCFKVEEGLDGPVGYLLNLCLEKKYRGHGFGTAALKALDKEAEKLGLRAMRLHVLANRAVAVHLYESGGYWIRTYEMIKEYPAKK